jgi:hypothetical protein
MLKLRCAWIWRVNNAVAWKFREHLGDDALMRFEWGSPSPSPSPSRTRLDTPPVDWGVVIQSLINVAIAEERFNREVMVGILAEVNDDLEHAVRSLTIELADLEATLAEVRLAFATDRTQALDLPNPLPKRAGLKLTRAAGALRRPFPKYYLPIDRKAFAFWRMGNGLKTDSGGILG